MTIAHTDNPIPRKPLRLWPGVVVVIVQWLLWLAVPVVAPDATVVAILGGAAGGLVVLLWWLFFSRAPWAERVGAIVLMIVAVVAIRLVLHKSIQAGMMGMMFFIYVVPGLSLALVAGAVARRRLSAGPGRAVMVAAILLACGAFTLLRTGGVTGAFGSEFHWRWSATPEERLLAQADDEPAALPTPPAAAEAPKTQPAGQAGDAPATSAASTIPEKPLMAPAGDKPLDAARGGPASIVAAPSAARTTADWPGFRGPGRDGIVRGVRIKTDWSASPPVEMWRRPVGPGWSSFAVSGDLLYTQEQRGDDEIVACYKLTTGAPVWRHRDATRFWESNGGAGPRATPTLSNGRVYAFGATGVLNALDAENGALVWSRKPAADTGTKVPGWGFTSSPLVVDDLVIVAVSGTLVAYDRATGDRRWIGPTHGESYSSPHLVAIDGVPQILMMSAAGATSVAAADGALLWEYPWPGVSIVQPTQIADGELLISVASAGGGIGIRRLAVAHGPGGWTIAERWTSNGLKPYFNDFVVHKGHAFGFDGSLLSCVDLGDGKRTWKGGRYGNGQLILLSDVDVLLVLSEEGELALVAATPDQFRELARFPGIEGKTWNHLVLVGDVLLIRNGQEMAAFRLPLAGR